MAKAGYRELRDAKEGFQSHFANDAQLSNGQAKGTPSPRMVFNTDHRQWLTPRPLQRIQP